MFRSVGLSMGLLLCSCITNDIPYPDLVASITELEVIGQIGTTDINNAAREVTVELSDTVDLKQVILSKFSISDYATSEPDLKLGDTMDLTHTQYVTLKIHDSFIWQLKGNQTIQRSIVVDNQVGEAIFDAVNKLALVNVIQSQPREQIQVRSMQLGPSNSTILPDPTRIHDFSTPQTFIVRYRDVIEEWTVRVMHTDANVVTGESNPWAKFAYLYGSYVVSLGEPTFEYRKKGTEAWTSVALDRIQISGTSFSSKVTGLEAQTEYEYRAVAGSTKGSTLSFTTEAMTPIPNLNFDTWCQVGKSWFPNADLTDENYWWDSGNKGANSLSEKNPTAPEDGVVVKGRAAKLASTKVLSVFAAGSVYLGYFKKVIGLGAEISMGRPYTARPTRLKGYYNYHSGVVDKTKTPYESLIGTQDSCHIYFLLSDAREPYTVNTTTQQFIDLKNDPNIVALGELKTSVSTSGYQPFTMTLNYRSLTRIPRYVLIVASASKYGDYFTGSTESVLYLDEFTLDFEE